MSIKKLQTATVEFARAVATGVVFGLVLMISYLAFEPVLSSAIEDEFTVRQEITGEIAFATRGDDIVMSPAIASLTGGTSTGETQVVVTSNQGYTMDIRFDSTESGNAMQLENGSSSIPNYPADVTPDFTFAVAANAAGFGYSVEATTTTDVDPTFLDNGANTCGTGTTDTADACWLAPSTTDERIISRSIAPPSSGSTSTIKFQVVVSPNPSPVIPTGFYRATATLTALVQ